MNGFSLLLAMASLGVGYSTRVGLDQQQEYLLQIEPEIVQALAEGKEIVSVVPPEAGLPQRLCIAILPKDGPATKHTPVGEEQFRQLLVAAGRYASRDRTLPASDAQPTILWPARSGASPDQTYGISTGWQHYQSGNQQYIVQIDPNVLNTLAIGDELYVPIDPAAGRLARFVVKAGRETLPRERLPPMTTESAPRTRYGGFSDGDATNWSNTSTVDTARPPARFGGGYNDAPADPRTTGPLGYGSAGANLPPNAYQNYGTPPPAGSNADAYRNYQTTGSEANPSAAYGARSFANQSPQLPAGGRSYNAQYPDARVATLPPAPVQSGTAAAFNAGSAAPPSAIPQQQDKPWGPLLFVTFALFFSIGGNLYLAYTALEFHSRYRNAIERLRSAARSA